MSEPRKGYGRYDRYHQFFPLGAETSRDMKRAAIDIRQSRDILALGSAIGSGPPARVAPRRAIHIRSASAGSVAIVVKKKKPIQPSFSASTPPDDATSVRPTAASEESSAYCVAVKAGEHRSER